MNILFYQKTKQNKTKTKKHILVLETEQEKNSKKKDQYQSTEPPQNKDVLEHQSAERLPVCKQWALQRSHQIKATVPSKAEECQAATVHLGFKDSGFVNLIKANFMHIL